PPPPRPPPAPPPCFFFQPHPGHDIDCKIPGFGQIALKSEVVKKIK
ncbi:PhnA domain-containing protein, partial [Staphylococcus pseudintermedius]